MKPLLSELEPSRGLYAAILSRITLERQRSARIQLAMFGAASFFTVLILIPSVQYALSEFYASGFYDYASLFFDSISKGYWQEILYSLADSLPSLPILILITVGGALAWSVRKTGAHIRTAFPGFAGAIPS
jgi:ABC-type Fe3+ transport system permease subunit